VDEGPHSSAADLTARSFVAQLFFSDLSKFALLDLVDEDSIRRFSRQMLEIRRLDNPAFRCTDLSLEKAAAVLLGASIIHKVAGPRRSGGASAFSSGCGGHLINPLVVDEKRGSELAGWLTGIFYVMCPLTIGMARIAMTDALLTFVADGRDHRSN